jgi:hypothetical protein
MAFDYTRISEIQFIPASMTSFYVNPTDTTSFVRIIMLFNQSATEQEVTLHNVPDSSSSPGTPENSNIFYSEIIPAGEIRIIEIPIPGMILSDVGDSIQGVCAAADAVTIQMFGGREVL